MDLSIGIVTYNNSDIIGETIQSILNHTSAISYRIIIHDNNSSDETVSVIRAIKSEKVELIEAKHNRGFGYGHNRIIEATNAQYHLVLNPDLRVVDNILKAFHDYMENNKEVSLLVPKVVYPNGEIQYLCKQNPTVWDLFLRRFVPQLFLSLFKQKRDRYEMRETNYDHIFTVPYASGCFMFFRSSVLKELGGFDERFFMYLEDADITRRINQISSSKFYPFNKVEHDWAKGSHRSLKLTWVTIQSAIYYFNKWGWKFW